MARPILLVSILLLGGCVSVPTQKDKAFVYAVEAVQRNAYEKGARAAWNFIDTSDPDDPRYDRGLRLLARSAGRDGVGMGGRDDLSSNRPDPPKHGVGAGGTEGYRTHRPERGI